MSNVTQLNRLIAQILDRQVDLDLVRDYEGQIRAMIESNLVSWSDADATEEQIAEAVRQAEIRQARMYCDELREGRVSDLNLLQAYMSFILEITQPSLPRVKWKEIGCTRDNLKALRRTTLVRIAGESFERMLDPRLNETKIRQLVHTISSVHLSGDEISWTELSDAHGLTSESLDERLKAALSRLAGQYFHQMLDLKYGRSSVRELANRIERLATRDKAPLPGFSLDEVARRLRSRVETSDSEDPID